MEVYILPLKLQIQSTISSLHLFIRNALLTCVGLALLAGWQISAQAKEGSPPPPLTGTYADYYVSWDHGDDANPGTFKMPFKTPMQAVNVLHSLPDPSGKIILIRSGTYRLRDTNLNRLHLKHLNGSAGAPIQIRGYPGERVVFDSFLDDFDPLAEPFNMPCGWGGICFNECSHILVENFTVMGRCYTNVELLSSDHITIRYIDASRSDKHGLFTGGSFHDLTIECCRFYEQMYGSTASHGVYISGGHWNPDLPPVRNITIRHVESFYNGRHAIQLNGRIENILIENCNLHHNILGGLSMIGCRNMVVRDNVIYKNNKQGIILFTYFDDDYWDINDPESVAHWLGTHWTTENVMIRNNTIFMDEIAWYTDEWVDYKPYYHGGIYMVDTSGLLPPFKNIRMENNIIHNHSKAMVEICNPEFTDIYGMSNLFLSEKHVESIGWKNGYTVQQMEYEYPDKWKDNLCGLKPIYLRLTPTDMIDGSYKQIDFSDPEYTKFKDDFHLRKASPAWKIGAGAFTNSIDLAESKVLAHLKHKLPMNYGKKIFQKIFKPWVSHELQQWFMATFNPTLDCLVIWNIDDGNERICFKDPDKKLVAFAIYNAQSGPVTVETLLTSPGPQCQYGNLSAFGLDRNMEAYVLPDLEFDGSTIKCMLGQEGIAFFIVPYE